MSGSKSCLPSPQYLTRAYIQHAEWSRVPMSKIRIDERLFSIPNVVSKEAVNDIVTNFDPELWGPATVDENFYLFDGQHRIRAAQLMGLLNSAKAGSGGRLMLNVEEEGFEYESKEHVHR